MPNAVSKIAERLVEAAVALNSKVGSYIEETFLKISKERQIKVFIITRLFQGSSLYFCTNSSKYFR